DLLAISSGPELAQSSAQAESKSAGAVFWGSIPVAVLKNLVKGEGSLLSLLSPGSVTAATSVLVFNVSWAVARYDFHIFYLRSFIVVPPLRHTQSPGSVFIVFFPNRCLHFRLIFLGRVAVAAVAD